MHLDCRNELCKRVAESMEGLLGPKEHGCCGLNGLLMNTDTKAQASTTGAYDDAA